VKLSGMFAVEVQKQIPYGNDRKKSKSNNKGEGKSKYRDSSTSIHSASE